MSIRWTIYYYKNLFVCDLGYIDLLADTDGSGGYELCGGYSDGAEYYGSDPTQGGGAVSQGPSPTPVSGSRPDHTPDFDVLHLDNHEISSNCNGCPTENVNPGQMLMMRLETQTNNRNVQTSDLYNSNSQSIDGEIWCRVEGHTSWQEIPGSEDQLEYDVSNLITADNSSVETISYTVPNYPGAILACYGKVDGDNEVREEGESNNNGRIERFLIVSGASQSSSPTSSDKAWMVPIINLILD